MQTLLNVNNLSVNFDTTQGIFTAVDDVSFYINKGECLGIAGESGSGKTQTFFSITGILSDNGSVSGNAYFNNIDLLRLNEKEISKIRSKQIDHDVGIKSGGAFLAKYVADKLNVDYSYIYI